MLLDMADPVPWKMVNTHRLVDIIRQGADQVMIIDSRSFLEYNTSHIQLAVNVCCSKLVKRRLQQDKVSVKDLLLQTCSHDWTEDYEIIVYDQCTENPSLLSTDCFLVVLLKKLTKVFKSVALLKGGFLEFQASHASLCESKLSGYNKCPPLTSMSQPCLPVANVGPTRILPFLYLGSQQDALSQETVKANGITYVLNVSTTCQKPPFIQEGHFLRIPVNDNYSDKLLPYFQDAFQFLDKVREANGCVLVHCLAGISRSPTLAIAYMMRHLSMSTDDAYRYVKDKRPTISPNFNFLGQLLEYEKQLKAEKSKTPDEAAALKRQCIAELRSPSSPTVATPKFTFWPKVSESSLNAQSPTTALAKLNFNNGGDKTPVQESEIAFPQFPTTSLDKLSFTPCFAKDDLSNSACTSGLPGTTKVLRPLASGTKRPLSSSVVESKTTACSSGNKTIKGCGDTSGSTHMTVTLRSPEMRAKRPLVRPNSIAFSSYPKSDFCFEKTDSAKKSICSTDDNGSTTARTSGQETQLVLRKEIFCPRKTEQLTVQVGKHSSPGPVCGIKSRNFEQGRKSRSLEDILNSPDEETDSGFGSTYRDHMMNAADMFSQPVALDSVQHRCRGGSDSHQSSSSISSSGSHNSLHGSLELIQVS